MPILYHRAPVAHSAKVLIVLAEKGIRFESRRTEVPACEVASVRAASQSGHLPVLVDDDGTTLAESSAIAEYLDETRPSPPLMPSDALARWRARVWFKFVNEDLAPAVAMLAWSAWRLPALLGDERAALAMRIEAITVPDRKAWWGEALAGFKPERMDVARKKVQGMAHLLEQRLSQFEFLAGPEYSLADVDAWPFVEPLPRLLPTVVNEHASPRLLRWMRRIGSREAVATVIADARDTDWTLGPELIRWG